MLAWAVGGFVGTCVFLVLAASLITPDVEPGYPITEQATVFPDGSFELTLDVRHREAWSAVDLGAGRVAEPGAAVDLRVRRYIFQAPGGALDLGEVPLADATLPPEPSWGEDVVIDGIQQNPTLARWYHYGWQSHLLSPKKNVYALRRPGGGTAFLQIASYYCAPEGSGCMTLRYRLAP